MNCDELTDAPGCSRTRFSGGLHGADITAHEDGDEAIQEVFLPYQDNACGLYHGVGSLHRADKTPRFDHPEGFHGDGTYQNPCAKAIDGRKSTSI
jgi:hypothetical protein